MTTKKPTPLPISELSLRDFFAAQALAWCMENTGATATWRQEAADEAYTMADAMLAERTKQL